MRSMLTEVQLAFGAAIYGLDRFISGTVQSTVAVQNFNAQTGLSIEKLQQWQQAGQLSNLALDANSIAQSIQNVSQNLAAIKLGQGNISPFQLLGIDVGNKDAFGVLDEVRERIKGLDSGIASNLISQIGLDPGMISVLRLSNEEFAKLSQNSLLGKGGRAAVMATGIAVRELKLKLQQLKDQAVAQLAPALNRIVNDVFKWIVKNQGKIVSAISSIVNGIKSFAVAIGNAINLASDFVENVMGMENGIKVLASGFALLALSFRPILLSLFLFIGLLDDIAVWSKGGKSLFGGFYDAIAKLGTQLKVLIAPFKAIRDSIKEAFGYDDKTAERIDKMSVLLKSLSEIGSSAAFGAILGYMTGGAKGAVVGAGVGVGVDALAQFVNFQKKIYDEGKVQRMGGVKNIVINVNGARDSAQVKEDVIDAINRDVQPSLNNGGM